MQNIINMHKKHRPFDTIQQNKNMTTLCNTKKNQESSKNLTETILEARYQKHNTK